MKPLPALARILSTNKGRTPVPQVLPSNFELGTIVGVNDDGTVNVTFSGSSADAVQIGCLGTFSPAVGMVVVCAVLGTQLWALGPTSPATDPAWISFGAAGATGFAGTCGAFGSNYAFPAYRLNGDRVELAGTLTTGSAGVAVNNPLTNRLPPSMQPTLNRTFAVLASGGMIELTIPGAGQTNYGQIITVNTLSANSAVLLDGCWYPVP